MDETESEPRFRMLETIREYAVDRLDAAAEDAAMRERHAVYLAFAEAAEPELVRANQVEWLERLALTGRTSRLPWVGSWTRTGSKRIASVGGDAILLAQASALGEGSRWLTAFGRPSDGVSPRTRARAIAAAGSFNHWLGHLEETRTLYQDALALFEKPTI